MSGPDELDTDALLRYLDGESNADVDEDAARELLANHEALAQLPLGRSVAAGNVGLRGRLLARAGGPDRFLPFLDRIRSLFDLTEDTARRHLDSIDEPDAWENMLPGVQFRDFDGGPAIGEAHGGLVRVQPGGVFPMHKHIGQERVLILQGEVMDEHGNRYRAGDLVVSEDGTSHEVRVVGDREAIYAAVVVALEFPDDDDDDDDD